MTGRQQILTALEKHGPMQPSDIDPHVEISRQYVRDLASRMYKDGELGKHKDGRYDLPENVEPEPSLQEEADDKKQVRHFGPASAGDGRELQPVGRVEMTDGEYRARFGARSVDTVGVFEVEGDSAAPVYFDGEQVPVEVKGETQDFQEDTVYVFRYRNDIMIKRLRTLQDGRIRAESLNPGIDDRILEPNGHDFEVVGRVIDNPKQQLYTSMIGRFMRMGAADAPMHQ